MFKSTSPVYRSIEQRKEAYLAMSKLFGSLSVKTPPGCDRDRSTIVAALVQRQNKIKTVPVYYRHRNKLAYLH